MKKTYNTPQTNIVFVETTNLLQASPKIQINSSGPAVSADEAAGKGYDAGSGDLWGSDDEEE